MLIKNAEILKKQHPNYSDEIIIIKQLADACVTILNSDLLQLAQSVYNVDWDVDVKKIFLSDQPKVILCNDASINDGKTHGFSLYFVQNVKEPYHIIVNHPELIKKISGSQPFDKMVIDIYVMEITFEKNGKYSGNFYLESQNGTPILKSYEINFN